MTGRLAVSFLLACLTLPAAAMAQPRPLFDDRPLAARGPQTDSETAPDQRIIVRPLEPPDALGVGPLPDPAVGWGDTPPQTVLAALDALPAMPASPTARALQIDLMRIPTPLGDPPGVVIAQRLQRLIDLGELEAAQSLLAEAPPSTTWLPALLPVGAELSLALGRDQNACQQADGTAEFVQGLGEIKLFCAVLREDTASALVLFNALNDTETLPAQPFGALVSAELGYGEASAVDWSAETRPIDVALAEHAGIEIPEDAVGTASLAAVARLADDAKSSATLRAAARARLEEARGNVGTAGPEATRLRAIADPVARANEIAALWRSTNDPAARRAYLAQLAPLAATIAPRVGLAEDAPILVSILIASGQEGAALSWFDMLETQRNAPPGASDRTAVLMILAGLIDPSRMPVAPGGLFTDHDASWLAAGLLGQGIPLSSPWQAVLGPHAPPAAGPPALGLAHALADVASDDPATFARGLTGLVAQDHSMDARSVARASVVVQLDG